MKCKHLQDVSALWDQVFARTPNASPFLSYEWFSTLNTSLLNGETDVVLIFDSDQPVAIICGKIIQDTYTLLTDERVTDVTDFLYIPGYEQQALHMFASFLKTRNLRIDLLPIDEHSPMVKLLPQSIDNIVCTPADTCPVLLLPESWKDYIEQLPTKQRHEVRRKLRRAADIEIRYENADHIDTFLSLMVSSDHDKEVFLNDCMRRFFQTVAFEFNKRRWLRLCIAYRGSTPIAGLLSFQHKQRIFLYNSGYDPDFAFLSPGMVAIWYDIKQAINENFKMYDFLRGDEKYKFSFGARSRSTVRLRR